MKQKNPCTVCRLVTSADEAKRHPSITSIKAVQFLIDKVKNWKNVGEWCKDHQPITRTRSGPVYRNIVHNVAHHVNLVAMKNRIDVLVHVE